MDNLYIAAVIVFALETGGLIFLLLLNRELRGTNNSAEAEVDKLLNDKIALELARSVLSRKNAELAAEVANLKALITGLENPPKPSAKPKVVDKKNPVGKKRKR